MAEQKFTDWHMEELKKMTCCTIGAAITGKILFAFAFGSLLHRELNQYSYEILLFSVLIVAGIAGNIYVKYACSKKVCPGKLVWLWTFAIVSVFMLGVQTPQLLAKTWLIGLSIVLLLPAMSTYFGGSSKKKKK